MSHAKKETMQHCDWIPTQGEFIRAITLAWLRVGYEAMTLLTYPVKQNEPTNVSANERGN